MGGQYRPQMDGSQLNELPEGADTRDGTGAPMLAAKVMNTQYGTAE